MGNDIDYDIDIFCVEFAIFVKIVMPLVVFVKYCTLKLVADEYLPNTGQIVSVIYLYNLPFIAINCPKCDGTHTSKKTKKPMFFCFFGVF